MLGVAGVFGGSLFSAMHKMNCALETLFSSENEVNCLKNFFTYFYILNQKEKTYDTSRQTEYLVFFFLKRKL